MQEIETKIRVERFDETLAKLRGSGATFRGRYLEHNVIFDGADGSLGKSGCGLRVREMSVMEGEAVPSTLTFKGPVLASAIKRREELETSVSDAGMMSELLRRIGFVPILDYRKRRERWVLDGCCVELDELPLLGRFVEVEGENESAVENVQGRIGLSGEPHVRHSYVRMLIDRCRELGRSMVGIDFDS